MAGAGENTHEGGGAGKPFFSGGDAEVTGPYDARTTGPGAQVGPFKLLGILGEGGYGIVYLAEQEQPIRRRVALKVIKPGMDSRQIVARFEAERQALALLDHPYIAHVHDAGTTPEGRPYFAMEYIEGLSITEYCDREKLSIKERLHLFLQVCEAVKHAHQKGIIHRDLKPSNMLVTAQNDKPLVKVIDFGIAKALAQPLTEKTLYTEQGQFIGTPDYMSPEQAQMDARGVDTRSDVYSLGVVLYELLTGMLPFDPDALRAGGVEHIRAVIRGEEPRTPSTRLTGHEEELTKIAQRRRTDPQTLTRSLHRELEWIPLKAMRKESPRRYQSVSALTDDIENYLQDRPLLAGPESIAYRTKKLIHRHNMSIAAAAATLVVLVVGLIVSTALYFTAERARHDAVQAQTAEQEQRGRADSARAEAEKRLVDLYENQGRSYLASGEFDRALVFLSEAYQIDGTRLSVRLSLLEGLRKHGDPNFRQVGSLMPWQSITTDQNLPFCVSPLRTLVAFADSNAQTIYVQRTDTGEQIRRLPASDVLNLAFTPDDRHIVAKIRKDQGHHVIKVFDIERAVEVISVDRQDVDINRVLRLAGEHPPERQQLEAAYSGILISPTASWFAFVAVEGAVEDLKPRVCVWDFAAHALRMEEEEFAGQFLIGIGYRVPAAKNGIDGLLIVDHERVVHSFAVPNLKFEFKFPFGATSAVFTRDGTRYMTFGEPSDVILSDRTSSNRTIRRFPGASGYAFSPDGRYAITERVTLIGDGADASPVRVDVWNAHDGDYVAGLRGTEIASLHFTPDSRHLVTAHQDREIRVWSLRDFASTFDIPGTESQVVADMSADGRWLLTRRADDAGPIRLYDLESGRSFEPYEWGTAGRDLSKGWAGATAGRVFSSPYPNPESLPLFNGDGSQIITGSGLRIFAKDTPQFRTIPALVAAYIPLRLENGNLRPAPPGDLLQAKAAYAKFRKGPQASETIRYQLQIAEQQRISGKLDEAVELALGLISLGHAAEAVSSGSSTGLFRELFEDLLSRGELSARKGRYEAALSDYQTAIKLAGTDPRPLKALAWLLATCPDAALRRSREARAYAEEARALMPDDDWEWSAVYAAACAADGDWPNAVTYQEKALRLLPEERKGRWLANYEERLRRYRLGRGYERQEFLDVLGNDLVARWDFEEPPNADALAMLADQRSVRLNWDIASLGTPQGHVLSFPGVCGYADCGPLQLPDPIGSLTVAAWGKWEDTERENLKPTLISHGNSWTLFRDPRTKAIAFQCGGLIVPVTAPYSHVVGRTPLLNDGKWRHFAGVYDGTRLSVYMDGALEASAEATGTISTYRGSAWVGLGSGGWTVWVGTVDDVRVYAAALNAEEIAGLYRRGKHHYEDLFFIDAGAAQAITFSARPLRLRASVISDTGDKLPGPWHASWMLAAGPRDVQFVPRNDILDPCVVFSGPGVYELRCTVEKGEQKAEDMKTIIVCPQGLDGLLAHYTFDHGDANDGSGQRIHGKLIGDACIVSDTERGSVLQLDGQGDYVDCGSDPRFDVNEIATIAAWVKVAALDRNHQSIVTKGDSAWGLCRNGQSDRLRLVFGGMEGLESWPGPVGVTPVNDEQWHHVVGVCDGAEMYLYIDGRRDASAKVTGRIRVNGEPVCIGENAEARGRYWNGRIDDVRIYNRALSAEEVAQLYEATK